MLESKRQQKVGKQIQKDLSDIFQKEAKSILGGAFVTVTVVRMSPDLGIARVYLSFLLAENNETLLANIKENTNIIRAGLGNRVRHQLRIVPHLNFFIDDTAEYAQKMDELFRGLDIPKE
jgi:ribosome-binding factor A